MPPTSSGAPPPLAALAGVRQQGRGDHEEDHAGQRRAVYLLGRSGPPGQGGDDGDPGDRAGRPRGGEVGGHHGQRHRRADHVPRQLEHADHVVGTGFQPRPVGQPDDQAQDGPGQRAHDPHQDAVDPDHQADVPVGGAQGAEHAEGAQAALRQHREAAHRDQGDEQHADRGKPQHDGLGVERVAGRRRLQALHVRAEGAGGYARCVEQDGDLGRRGDLTRHDEGELIQQALRVLHDADDLAGLGVLPALVPHVTDLEVEGGGHAIGHGHLARPGRVVAGDQGEHRNAERPVRILGAQVVGVDRAGDGDGLVLDDVDAAEALLQRGDLAGQLRAARLERGHVLGGAEARAGRRRRVGGHRRPDDGGGQRDHDERQDQQLLAPLAAEHPPRPADHGAAGGNAPVGGSRPGRALAQPCRVLIGLAPA